MNIIEYTLESPEIWLQQLHQKAPTTLKNNKLELLPDLGFGSIQTLQIQDGLYVTITDVQLNVPILLKRTAKPTNDGFILNIYLSDSKVETTLNNNKFNLGVNDNKVILSSSSSSAELIFPTNTPLKICHIYLTRSWMLENAFDQTTDFHKAVTNDFPIYIIENLDYTFIKVKELIIPLVADLNKIKLGSIVFQVLEHLNSKLEKRTFTDDLKPLKSKDLQSLMQAIKTIETTIPSVITNSQLAKQCGMSLSKFKHLFKQVYGISPYQYHVRHKMNLAFELLQRKEHSVSEVGFLIGYKNLSQFSKRFFKEFNVLPSDI